MKKYHMRRTEKEIKEDEVIAGILKNGRYAVLSLCRNEEPYIVTMNYGYDGSGDCLYFHCAREGIKLEFIKRNPAVCATVIEDLGYRQGECDHAYRSVLMRGEMNVLTETGDKEHALDMMIYHLEENPEPVNRRIKSNEKALTGVCILRLDIHEVTAKQGAAP